MSTYSYNKTPNTTEQPLRKQYINLALLNLKLSLPTVLSSILQGYWKKKKKKSAVAELSIL